MAALNLFVNILNHVVAQIVKAHLVVCSVCDVCGIGFSSFLGVKAVDNKADGEAEEAINLSHPLAVTPCKVIVDGDDMNALSGQCVEIGRKGCNKGFTLAGFHFGNSALVENNAALKLNGEVLH